MIVAAILAGGSGKRFGSTDLPKQFLDIKDKPIIIHTIEKFIVSPTIDYILVLTPKEYIQQTKSLIDKYIKTSKSIEVISGGSTRNETIINAVNYIDENLSLSDDTILITHDAVRPFVTERIIKDNIELTKEFRACDTVIPATDTIVEGDSEFATSIPDRSHMFQGQTPQTFYAKELRDTYNSLSEKQKSILTDAAKIYLLLGKKVALAKGETFNLKITYPYDLKIARALLEEEVND